MMVDLTDQEWQQVLGILAMAPWRDANPLLMKIGEQLRLHQQERASQPQAGYSGLYHGNSRDQAQ